MNKTVAINPAAEISIRQTRKTFFHDCDSRIIANPLNNGSSPVPDNRNKYPSLPAMFRAFSG